MPPDPRIDQHDHLLEKIVELQIRTDEQLKQMTRRSEAHDDDIRDIRKNEVIVGKILERLKMRNDIVQWVLAVTATAVIGYLVLHFLPR